MDERNSVSPSVAAMASADAAKVEAETLGQKLVAYMEQAQQELAAGEFSKLAITSQMVVRLQGEIGKQARAKLEAKLNSELDELIDCYTLELATFTELRVHMKLNDDGTIKHSVTLFDVVAPAPKPARTTPMTTASQEPGMTRYGKLNTAQLLKLYGSEIVADGKTYQDLWDEATKAKDRSNATFVVRKRLLARHSKS